MYPCLSIKDGFNIVFFSFRFILEKINDFVYQQLNCILLSDLISTILPQSILTANKVSFVRPSRWMNFVIGSRRKRKKNERLSLKLCKILGNQKIKNIIYCLCNDKVGLELACFFSKKHVMHLHFEPSIFWHSYIFLNMVNGFIFSGGELYICIPGVFRSLKVIRL